MHKAQVGIFHIFSLYICKKISDKGDKKRQNQSELRVSKLSLSLFFSFFSDKKETSDKKKATTYPEVKSSCNKAKKCGGAF